MRRDTKICPRCHGAGKVRTNRDTSYNGKPLFNALALALKNTKKARWTMDDFATISDAPRKELSNVACYLVRRGTLRRVSRGEYEVVRQSAIV